MTTQSGIHSQMGAAEWIMLVVLSVLWGGSFFFVEVAVRELPPLVVVWLRVALGAIALWGVAFAMGVRFPVSGRLWLSFAIMGLLNNLIPFALIAWGQTQIASGLASILNATTPLFTVLVATVLLTDERMTTLKAMGVLIGFSGVVVMIGPDALEGLGLGIWAQLAILGAALSYAFASVFGRRFAKLKVDPIQTAAGQVTASALLLCPIVFLVDQPWTLPVPGIEVIGSILGLVMLSTALAYVLYFRILSTAGATNLSLVTFLIPVSAILLGVLVLGETLDPNHLAGMFLIACGLAAIDGRLFSLRRRKAIASR